MNYEGTCCAALGPMVLPRILSHRALLAFALSFHAQVQAPSLAHQQVWDRVDIQFLAFPQCNHLFSALMLSGVPWLMIFALMGYTRLSSCS